MKLVRLLESLDAFIISLDMEKETLENAECATWDDFFLGQHDILQKNGVVNLPRTRVVILSGTNIYLNIDCTIETVYSNKALRNKGCWEQDVDRVNCLQSSPETNNIKFTVLDLGEYFHSLRKLTRNEHRNRKIRLLQDIRNLYPTVIVLSFCAAKFLSIDNALNIVDHMNKLDKNRPNGAKFDGRDGIAAADVLKELRKNPSLWQEPLLVTAKGLLFKTKNIIQFNYTFLSSVTRLNACGIEDSLPRMLDGIKYLGNLEYISILFISGTHGNRKGVSGFSNLALLEPIFYEESCKLLGIDPQYSIPTPEAQPLDENAEDDAILRDPLYRMMRFNVLDIRYFHKDETGLIKYIRAFNPNAIVLDWCYTKGGDVANVLCRSGILTELWLKHERTSMGGLNMLTSMLSQRPKRWLEK